MSGSAGGETTLVDDWIESKMEGSAAIQANFGVPVRIYEGVAPEETQYPFITYDTRLSVDTNGVGPDTRIFNRSEYVIKVTGEYSSYSPMREYVKDIDALLNGLSAGSSGELVTGGSILAVQRLEEYRQTETHEGRTLRHLGGVYSIFSYSDS